MTAAFRLGEFVRIVQNDPRYPDLRYPQRLLGRIGYVTAVRSSVASQHIYDLDGMCPYPCTVVHGMLEPATEVEFLVQHLTDILA